jgi:Holliday junction resolvase RusA-like endonuclease
MSEADLLLSVTVPGEPVPKSRARLGRGRAYTPAATTTAEQRFGWAFRAAKVARNDHDDLGLRVVFRASTHQRRDLDNCIKLVCDAANGIVWRDDVQVTRIEADMIRGVDDPGTTVEVWIARARERRCEACGAGPLTAGQAKYCSKRCYDGNQRRGIVRRCKGCGVDVYRQAGKSQARVVFCTPECRRAQGERCRNCGKVTVGPPSQPRVFCSPTCSSTWYRTNGAVRVRGGTCACGAPVSRGATRCRACHYSRRATS